MKSVDVYTEIIIRGPLAEVAAYSSNPGNATEWYSNIKSVKWLSDAGSSPQANNTLRLGSRIAFTANFLGKQLAYTYEVVDFVPNEKFVMRTSDGPFPMETTYIWTSISEVETRMSLRNRGVPSGFSKKLGLQRLDEMHLYSFKEFNHAQFGFMDIGTTGNITYMYIIGSICLFILLIACINFMNLTT